MTHLIPPAMPPKDAPTPPPPSITSRALAALEGFDVVADPTGIMLHCRRCGVHNWQSVTQRSLVELVDTAAKHRPCAP